MRSSLILEALFGYQLPFFEHTNLAQDINMQALNLRILTHNIRYAPASLFENERPWEERFPLIMNQFFYHTRHIPVGSQCGNSEAPVSDDGHLGAFICLQEALHGQLYDILGSLNNMGGTDKSIETDQQLPKGPLWSHIGVAREDGKTQGEYSPILYPTRIFDLLHFENHWLSPTPNKPSKGWDAGSERILTSGVFEHKATKKRLAVFNTHLDNAGTVAREKSVAIILQVIERTTTSWHKSTGASDDSKGERLGYILTGDFNSFPTQEAYQALAKSNTSVDVHEAVAHRERYGSENTFTGFVPDTDRDKDEIGRIDYVWLGPKSRVNNASDSTSKANGWHVQGYSVLPNVWDDGVFCSDHRCVVGDVQLL